MELESNLYLNRAACHFHLGNYRSQITSFLHNITLFHNKVFFSRSSLNDSLQAAKLKPDYTKAIVRAAQCCLKLRRFSDGLKWCDYGIRLKDSDPALVKLRTDLVQGQVCAEKQPMQ